MKISICQDLTPPGPLILLSDLLMSYNIMLCTFLLNSPRKRSLRSLQPQCDPFSSKSEKMGPYCGTSSVPVSAPPSPPPPSPRIPRVQSVSQRTLVGGVLTPDFHHPLNIYGCDNFWINDLIHLSKNTVQTYSRVHSRPVKSCPG